jgi:rubrerythrin
MDNVISEQSVINTIHKTIYNFFDVVEDDSEEPMNEKDKLLLRVNKAICNEIKKLPPARKIGRWIYSTNNESVCEEWTCNLCGISSFENTNYCPNCGANMRGEEDD